MFDVAVDLVRETLMYALLIAAPILIAGMAIGLIVSIVQTVTQIQEQTLSFVPKIAGMMAVAIALIPWIIERILAFAVEMFAAGF